MPPRFPRMKLASLVGLATVLLLATAACTGDGGDGETDDPTATATTSAATTTAEPTPEATTDPIDGPFEFGQGGYPVTDDNRDELIAAAAEHAGLEARSPLVFPEGGYTLGWVDASRGPDAAPDAIQMLQFIYSTGETSLNVYQHGTALTVQGELYAEDLAGFDDIHADFGDPDESGDPTFAAYTARSEDVTYVLVFGGDVPTDEELEDMLASIPR